MRGFRTIKRRHDDAHYPIQGRGRRAFKSANAALVGRPCQHILVAGNIRSLRKVHRVVERYWFKMLRSRSRNGGRLTWDAFNQIKERTPLLPPKLRLPFGKLQALAVL